MKKEVFLQRYRIRRMNRSLLYACLAAILVSCQEGGKKKVSSEKEIPTAVEQTDSIVTEDNEEDFRLVEDEGVPAQADESFADFFYNFSCDVRFQKDRIVFPISYYKDEEVVRMTRDDWEHDSLFSKHDAYTVIFDSPEDMEIEEDTSLTSVQIDWIYLKERKVKRYYFERIMERWYLEAINIEDMTERQDETEDFFVFYERFSTDSIFQRERLHDPLKFITADPEDDFQILETTLDPGQWFAFRPPLLQGWLSNIHYGQPQSVDSKEKILEIKGFGNGANNTLYFELRPQKGTGRNVWKLMEYEDLSD